MSYFTMSGIAIVLLGFFFVSIDASGSTFGLNRLSNRACLAASRRGRRRPSGSQGFGKNTESPTSGKGNTENTSPSTKKIYSAPALYDLAFGYRDYEEEVDFLVSQHQLLHEGKAPSRVLELAAGPARHCVQALKTLQADSVVAIDLSPEMVKYGKTIASETLEPMSKLDAFQYIQGDMRSFDLPKQSNEEELFDSAWILLGSLQHLTTNTEVISCFESIQKALIPGGTLILELPHPRETFSMVECTKNKWEIPLEDDNGNEYGELEIIWGDEDDEFDPIRQVRQFTVSMELKGVKQLPANEDIQSVREVVPTRLFTSQEIDALARIAGFEISSMHGALAEDVDLSDEDEAFRLVCVLQKIK